MRSRQDESVSAGISELQSEGVISTRNIERVVDGGAGGLVDGGADGAVVEGGAVDGLDGGDGALGESLVLGILGGDGGAGVAVGCLKC